MILLVTGSRSLENYRTARRWVHDAIQQAIVVHDIDAVVSGNASGPDVWSSIAAMGSGVAHIEFQSNETAAIVPSAKGKGLFPRVWLSPPEAAVYIHRNKLPLARNVAMVSHVARFAPKVRVLAFMDPQSTTHGTLHTVNHARDAGLTVDVRTWSGEPS